MNFDDIKDAWNNDQDSNKVTIPSSIDQLKPALLPVERMRKTMRSELLIQLVSIILIGFAPRFFHLLPVLTIPFYALYVGCLVISAYYFFRFYGFYKKMDTGSLTSKDSLYSLYYEARLNIEMYKSFTYMLFPFMLIMAILFLISGKGEAMNKLYNLITSIEQFGLWLALTFASGVFLLILMTELWSRSSYGKYLQQIKAVLDEFKE